MSLTVLIDLRDKAVTIVPWFRDSKFNLEHACLPLRLLTFSEFLSTGPALIKGHLTEYKTHKVDRGEFVSGLGPNGVRKFKNAMRYQVALRIDEYPIGTILISPQKIEQCDLAGLLPLSRDLDQPVSMLCDDREFFSAFQSALREAEKHN